MRIFDIASQAISEQYARLRQSAANVAKVNGPLKEGETPPDIAKETVKRIEADNAVRANLAVIREEDDRIKHLLDMFI